jgi:hypothetical protein
LAAIATLDDVRWNAGQIEAWLSRHVTVRVTVVVAPDSSPIAGYKGTDPLNSIWVSVKSGTPHSVPFLRRLSV